MDFHDVLVELRKLDTKRFAFSMPWQPGGNRPIVLYDRMSRSQEALNPLTMLVLVRMGIRLPYHAWRDAARLLGLDDETAERISGASCDVPWAPAKDREALLEAFGRRQRGASWIAC